MPKFDNAGYKVSFSVPDEPTVLQLLSYDSIRVKLPDDTPPFVALWECAKPIITDWQCEEFPSKDADIAKLAGKGAARIVRMIEWAGVTVSAWRRALDTIEKN